jgi:hypothetical protein
MAWTNIANANLDVGAPIRSVDILALRDNITALANGDTGAPPIKAAALGSGQTGNAPIFAARAWVNFDGTGTFAPNPSTSKIRASGNISSIGKISTGTYEINFATAMPDSNYAISGVCNNTQANLYNRVLNPYLTQTTTKATIRTSSGASENIVDHEMNHVVIFR